MRHRAHRNGCVQLLRCRGDPAVDPRRDLPVRPRLLNIMSDAWSQPIAPALMAAGFLCVILPWSNRENPFVRATLVSFALLMTWHYLLWRFTTLPPLLSLDWFFGIAFLGTELLTGIGGTITWILLTRSSSRSATVAANMPWLLQARPLVDVLI